MNSDLAAQPKHALDSHRPQPRPPRPAGSPPGPPPAGAEVTLAVRDPDAGERTAAEIIAATGNRGVKVGRLDLSAPTSIAAFTRAWDGPLHLLINNAGVMALQELQLDPRGWELQFAVNHLGHFALTAHVLPLLRAAGDARVVALSSLAARQSGKIHFDDLQFEKSYAAMSAYGQSKLANLMFARELDRRSREAGWGVLSNAAHPGLTKTNLQITGPSHGREKPALMQRLYTTSWRWAPFLWQEIDDGILPALYAATTPHAEGGAFYGPSGFYEMNGGGVKVAHVPARARNDADSKRLWELSEQLTGVSYPNPH